MNEKQGGGRSIGGAVGAVYMRGAGCDAGMNAEGLREFVDRPGAERVLVLTTSIASSGIGGWVILPSVLPVVIISYLYG
jgi:hypothetical protein